jgi:hypothetical protein
MELKRHHLSRKGKKPMTSNPIIARFGPLKQLGQPRFRAQRPRLRYWTEHKEDLPRFVRQSPVAMRYLRLLGPLAWDQFPERFGRPNRNPHPIPHRAFAAACLVKLDQQLVSMGTLRQYLVEHPELVWLFGFPLTPAPGSPCRDSLDFGFVDQADISVLADFACMNDHRRRSVLVRLNTPGVTDHVSQRLHQTSTNRKHRPVEGGAVVVCGREALVGAAPSITASFVVSIISCHVKLPANNSPSVPVRITLMPP